MAGAAVAGRRRTRPGQWIWTDRLNDYEETPGKCYAVEPVPGVPGPVHRADRLDLDMFEGGSIANLHLIDHPATGRLQALTALADGGHADP